MAEEPHPKNRRRARSRIRRFVASIAIAIAVLSGGGSVSHAYQEFPFCIGTVCPDIIWDLKDLVCDTVGCDLNKIRAN